MDGSKTFRSVILKDDAVPFLKVLEGHEGMYNFTDRCGMF